MWLTCPDENGRSETRTCFLRLEIVVLLHCLNLFIPIESIERDLSVLSHLYIILINKKQKDVLSSLHMQTHTNVHRKQVAMNITYYSRLDLFSFFLSSFFFFASKRMEKKWLYELGCMIWSQVLSRNQINEDSLLRCILSSLWVCVYKLYSFL